MNKIYVSNVSQLDITTVDSSQNQYCSSCSVGLLQPVDKNHSNLKAINVKVFNRFSCSTLYATAVKVGGFDLNDVQNDHPLLSKQSINYFTGFCRLVTSIFVKSCTTWVILVFCPGIGLGDSLYTISFKYLYKNSHRASISVRKESMKWCQPPFNESDIFRPNKDAQELVPRRTIQLRMVFPECC